MEILFLASRFPYPLTQGDRLRTYYLLKALANHHRVTLVTPIQTDEEYEALSFLGKICHRIEVIPVSKLSRSLNLIKAPLLSLPWQVTYYSDCRLQKTIDRLLSTEKFDLVHVQLARMAPFLEGWNHVPKVLDLIDALSLNMARRAKQENGLRSWLFAAEAERMEKYERRLISSFNQLTVCSAIDQKAIGGFSNLHVVPNGVDFTHFPFVDAEREPNTLIFTGNMKYFPNINAVQYFIGEVLPKIRTVIPQINFTVVGPHLAEDLQKQFEQAGVTVAGFVPDVHAYLKKSAVAIAPMRSGSGIQNKVLEAMATGTPVVATSYGIGSLPVESGKHLLVEDDPEQFAQAIIELLNDQTLKQHLVTHARQLVESHFSWDSAVEQLEAVYEQAVLEFHPDPAV